MGDIDDFPIGHLSVDGQGAAFVDLPALFGRTLNRLPVVLRLLLAECHPQHVRDGTPRGRRRGLRLAREWKQRSGDRWGNAVVLLAGERYGTGSSRDWAAKGRRLLGMRAVLALSFERIHRSNLIGMGIPPLRLPVGLPPGTLDLQPGDRIRIEAPPASIAPRCVVPPQFIRVDGTVTPIAAIAAVETQLEAELLRDGGAIPSILKKTISTHRPGPGAR
jgi:hypothetical protein